MWRLLQKEQTHEAFKEVSQDSTRALGQHVLGQRDIRVVHFQEFCGQERATDNTLQNKVSVRTSTKIPSFKFKVTLHEGLSINFSKDTWSNVKHLSHTQMWNKSFVNSTLY